MNPVGAVALPRLPATEQRFLSAEQLERLADEMATPRDRSLVLLLGWVGLRFGEAAALRRADVDLLRRRARIGRAVSEVRGILELGSTKTHQARTVALPSFVANEIGAAMAADSELVFPNRDGGFLRVTAWKRRAFDPAAERAGLAPPPLRVHDLRHTAAALAIASGANVKMVQRQLGHRSATLTLDRYGHLFPDELDGLSDALELMRSADSVRTLDVAGAVIRLG